MKTLAITFIIAQLFVATAFGGLTEPRRATSLQEAAPDRLEQQRVISISEEEKRAADQAFTVYATCYAIFKGRNNSEGMEMMISLAVATAIEYIPGVDPDTARERFIMIVNVMIIPRLSEPPTPRIIFLAKGGCEQVIAEAEAFGFGQSPEDVTE